ncbi:MAG: hypothetical protein ACHQ6T_00540 [Myxococcota bacterium]
MLNKTTTSLLCAAVLLGSPMASHAFGISDRTGDFLSSFSGSHGSGDLDVTTATVIYDSATDLFSLSATMNGTVGSTASGLYVWGVNRGAGVSNFEPEGIDGVRFDLVVILSPSGTGQVLGVGNLPLGSVTVSGDTITAVVSGSLLPSTGFAKLDYTWNLWPLDSSISGFAAISDFAPDNANFTTTPGTVVPEPAASALILSALSFAAWATRRRTIRPSP